MSSLSSPDDTELDEPGSLGWRTRVAGGDPAVVAEEAKPTVYNLNLKVSPVLMREINRLAVDRDQHYSEWIRSTLISVVFASTGIDPEVLRGGLSTPRRHRGAVPRR